MTTRSVHRSTETTTLATEITLKVVARLRDALPNIDFSQLRFEYTNRSEGRLFRFDFICRIGRPTRPGDIYFELQGLNGLGGSIVVNGHFRVTNRTQGYAGTFTGTASAAGRGHIDLDLDIETAKVPPLIATVGED
jgi:hypothetical protein